MNQLIDDSERDTIFQNLKSNPDNNKCFDCEKKNPKWSSVYLGIYLCLDCAGKHREYGPQVSFARSLNLDTWNRRYITFMEQGGNTKALDYFKKHGLKTPYDYKNPIIQKYKTELTKKVDAALAVNTQQAEISHPVTVSKAEGEEPKQAFHKVQASMLAVRSYSDKPTHGESSSNDDPFAGNIVLNKGEVKTKGFTVEFNNKNKSSFGSNKGRLAAKRIENVDVDSLSLNEDSSAPSRNTFGMADNVFGICGKNEIKEVSSNQYGNEQPTDKFKQFQNAKAISSDAFRNDRGNQDASNIKKFTNATAISSDMYFGRNEEDDYF